MLGFLPAGTNIAFRFRVCVCVCPQLSHVLSCVIPLPAIPDSQGQASSSNWGLLYSKG